nr:immunoglobulin light chain junction region [Macaca mulatta]
CMQAVEFPFTF